MLSHSVLSVREHQNLAIGEQWDPRQRMVSGEMAIKLDRLRSQSGVDFVTVGRRTLRFSEYVGTIGLNDRAIDVLPKVDGLDEGEARSRLVEMLAVAGMIPEAEAGLASLTARSNCLLDTFLTVYVKRLAVEWRRGPIRRYAREEANRSALRGKLLFSEHLRRNSLRPDRFFTRADEWDRDVPVTRLLKAALRTCVRCAVSAAPRRAALELLPDFDGVRDTVFDDESASRVTTDRCTERFEPAIRLARMIVAASSPAEVGDQLTYSIVFDMNELFEKYIAVLLARTALPDGMIVRSQVAGKHLLFRGDNPVFGLRPDIAIVKDGNPLLLIDTKWKRLDKGLPYSGVKSSDIYQMYAYGTRFDCPRIVLLYPAVSGIDPLVATYRYTLDDADPRRILVRTIDVGVPAVASDGPSVARQLRAIVEGAVA